ncbi:MAG TPA: hypothetical protein VHL77_01855 [Ferruginibacter sp.]|jgi:hypothetical protein|nr:hypothetical protein [Ferruginibacter sp.]
MKKFLRLEISITEAIVFLAIVSWIVISCFVELPDVNSLGV